MGILLRWLGAYLLLAATFNPTQWNFIRWAGTHYADQLPLTLLLGLLLFVGFLIYFEATIRSIGRFGMLLIVAIFGLSIWVLIDWGVLALDNRDQNVWLGLLALSLVLGVGLSWSIVRQRLSGQASVDDVED
ncbi:DUF6524 family protein [Rhodobacter ferrooxidans]|uniref:Uncharacterized protein n=1 Tax=Rhodobacter ferrooxidans TaxID=371731 RepID=C8S068_9RHOB|nr:DUF6524 family protein [Rhodobacter sp. SW2]EEW25677.1 conserved hypothetical protein [Rhodobacter sp. SW2]